MLCQIPEISRGVLSLFVSGRISALDYAECLQPLLQQYHKEFGRVCIYIEADVLLEGWETVTVHTLGEIQLPEADALALVGGPDWIGNAVQLLGPFVQGDIAWFPLDRKNDARQWISNLAAS